VHDRSAEFQGTVPEFYDRYLGPFLFEPFAADLAGRVTSTPGQRVLELACGTGIATRRLSQALGAGAELVATDLNVAMLDVARANLRGAEVHWHVADAQELPFRDGAFDAVACQFGFMFLPDKAAGLRESRRVLRRGGRLLASIWCSLDENPAARIVNDIARRMFPQDPPRFLEVPYGMGDATTMVRLVRDAGFADVTAERVEIVGTVPSARLVATGFAKGSPLSRELLDRGADLEAVAEAFTEALAAHGGEPFRSPLAAFVVTAS
jgi:ubiquinone/menaquinone biosynthesis C-methylase UbiE